MRGSAGEVVRLQLVCRGVVQGVGARPALSRLATALLLRGSLHNRFDLLEIDLCGPRAALEHFLLALPTALPVAARLEQLEVQWFDPPDPPWPEGIGIGASAAIPLGRALVAPGLSADRAPCPACLTELDDPSSRRHRYPFISCCVCGPRFSLANALPFCRAHTTLKAFPPCPACARDFSDPANRRFHAETISCPLCGPRLSVLDGAGRPQAAGPEAALDAAADLLHRGQILALQGVGGFQLLVDASNASAVERLRLRKHRPAKPFALLIADPRELEPAVVLSGAEEEALRHPAAPIVLLRRRWIHSNDPWASVAPGSPALGVMLPASALHHLLVRLVGRPLVATSGNRSGEPLCLAPGEAQDRLAGIADAFLVHDLPIARPLDDSVLQLVDGRLTLLRRARGFVPESLPLPPSVASFAPPPSAGALLALGGDLKAAPALVLGDRFWLAPHLGDLADAGVQHRWQGGVEEQLRLSSLPVGGLACDAHPGYVSHQLASQLAQSYGLPLARVPHHLAHGLAVMAEHGAHPPLLVVACDGLGLGELAAGEGQERLWGGELLLLQGSGTSGLHGHRLAALRPFPLPGGERASREPRRCALGLLAAAGSWALAHPGARPVLEAFSYQERHLLLQAIAQKCNAPPTSSMGRLFDGVASLLGLAQTLTYEGEGGLRWQGAAARCQTLLLEAEPGEEPWPFPLRPSSPGERWPLPLGRWDWEPLLGALLADRAAGRPATRSAWQVERSVVQGMVQGVAAAAAWSGCRQVALTGGCFQNRSLLEGCLRGLRQGGLEPLWSQKVPCNDGGLALGQALAVRAGWSGL